MFNTHKERLTGEDNAMSSVIKLAGGNPGAITVCMELLKKAEEIDKDSIFGPFSGLLLLDSAGIYEDKIWYLYKDNCKQDLVAMMAVLRGFQLGLISQQQLHSATDYMNGGKPLTPEVIKEVYEGVRKICTQFDTANAFQF